jgi:hypothetical protein
MQILCHLLDRDFAEGPKSFDAEIRSPPDIGVSGAPTVT